jgi:hypothetical protein
LGHKILKQMVDEGGSVPQNKQSLDESSSDSSSFNGGKEESGGKQIFQNESIQVVEISPYGKGLGKQPLDFEKIASQYDKDNNVIDLIPGVGFFLFFYFFYLFFRQRRWNSYK